MKQLKFLNELVPAIERGEKTATWRLYDDKDITVGDTLEFVIKETGEVFGHATITDVLLRTLGTMSEADKVDHEPYLSTAAMIADFQQFYEDKVSTDTEVKIVRFDFTALE